MWESAEPEQNEEASREPEGTREQDTNAISGLEVRLLIAEEEAPVLIGKGGSNCKHLRERNGVYLTLGKTSDAAERICTIKGSVENLSQTISQIADLFVKNAAQIHKAPRAELPSKVTVAMLVHESLAGLVIGRKGAVAKAIFTEIKGKIKVSDTSIPYTTDKVAYLTGTPEQLKHIMTLVLRHLVDKSPKTDSPVRNYFPEGRVTYRFEENQWPKPPPPRGRSPPRDWRDDLPPRRFERSRSRERYDTRGPLGDRYSERPAFRAPYDDRYGPRDPFDRYDTRGASPPRGPDYYPSRADSYAQSAYPPTRVAPSSVPDGHLSRPEYASTPGSYSQSYSSSFSAYPSDRTSLPPSAAASSGGPVYSDRSDPYSRADLDRRGPPLKSAYTPGAYAPGVYAPPVGYAQPEPSTYGVRPGTSLRPVGFDARDRFGGTARPAW